MSIALNISEGSSRGSDAEFKRFLNISRASLDEVVTALFIAKDQNFINETDLRHFYDISNSLGAKIMALIKKLT